MKLKNLAVVTGIGLAFCGLYVYYSRCENCFSFQNFSPETLRDFIKGFGSWSVLVYIFLYILNTFSPLLPPIGFMSLAAGVLFGPVMGTVALTLATFCGTSAAFFAARYLGRSWIECLVKKKSKSTDLYEKLGRNGFSILLPMRLIGFPPYGIIDFICGFSKMTYQEFIAATMIGAAPWIVTQVLLADRFTHFNFKDPVLWILIVVFIFMIIVTGKIVKRNQLLETKQ